MWFSFGSSEKGPPPDPAWHAKKETASPVTIFFQTVNKVDAGGASERSVGGAPFPYYYNV
jgi:hypothetical protein